MFFERSFRSVKTPTEEKTLFSLRELRLPLMALIYTNKKSLVDIRAISGNKKTTK